MSSTIKLQAARDAAAGARTRLDADIAALSLARERVEEARAVCERLTDNTKAAIDRQAGRMEAAARA